MGHEADEQLTDSLFALEREVATMMRRVKRVLAERAAMIHPELQGPGYMILGYLAQSDAVRSADIAGRLDLDKGAVSRQVQHLIELGLVEKSQDPDDRRAWMLHLAPATRERMQEVRLTRLVRLKERLSEWEPDDFDTLVRLLTRYNETLA